MLTRPGPSRRLCGGGRGDASNDVRYAGYSPDAGPRTGPTTSCDTESGLFPPAVRIGRRSYAACPDAKVPAGRSSSNSGAGQTGKSDGEGARHARRPGPGSFDTLWAHPSLPLRPCSSTDATAVTRLHRVPAGDHRDRWRVPSTFGAVNAVGRRFRPRTDPGFPDEGDRVGARLLPTRKTPGTMSLDAIRSCFYARTTQSGPALPTTVIARNCSPGECGPAWWRRNGAGLRRPRRVPRTCLS